MDVPVPGNYKGSPVHSAERDTMGNAKWFLRQGIIASLAFNLRAEPAQTLDLKPFAGPSPIQTAGIEWAMPRGRQVFDGTPFQMDGAVLLHATNAEQKAHPGRTNAIEIPVGRTFERVHLLAASDTNGTNHVPVARLRFSYADGSSATADLIYGEHLRGWQGPWHKAEPPLTDTNARVAWCGQNSVAATGDRYLRLYHVTLANPSPDKEVRSLALESAETQCGLLLLALTVGPTRADPLSDTWTPPHSPFPDLRPRDGGLVRGEGLIENMAGQPLAGVRIRVMAARKFNTDDGKSSESEPGAGAEAVTDAKGHFILPPLPDTACTAS